MKKLLIIFSTSLLFTLVSCCGKGKQEHNPGIQPIQKQWLNYFVGNITFTDEAPETLGSEIYRHIIPDPATYIAENALRVLQTLYYSPDDSIPHVSIIDYRLRDYAGVAAKSGEEDSITIVYSTQWIEKSFADNDTAKLDYETRGVLYHELTHAYQLRPKGCGTYADRGEFWAFIEGMADAVRVANGCFGPDDRPKNGTYLTGYRTTGFFFYWLDQNKQKDFIKKLNHSALEINPWSFDKAFKHIFGDDEKYHIDNLWDEYMIAMGDTPEEKK